MSKRHNSPQNGPVDVKTDKDSHTPRTGHTEAAGRQNEAHTPTTDEVCECWTTRDDIGNPYETDADVEERHHEESVKFDRWLRTVKAEAWSEGHRAAWEASGDGWNGEVNGISSDYDELVRGGMFEDNPYESEEA